MKKLFNSKSVVALALALFLVMPMVFSALPVQAAGANPDVSIVLSGTTSTAVIPAGAVGSSFSVDVRVDNTASVTEGINGASYSVTWDPDVLECTATIDGTAFWGQKGQYPGDLGYNNIDGIATFGQIIIDTTNANAHSAQATGVMATLTFQVKAVGQSNLNLQPSDVGIAYLTKPVGGNSVDVLADAHNAIYNPISTEISLYQHGTMNPVVQYTAGGNPINSTIQVDIYMSNQRTYNIWAWNLGVNWNPTVLQLVDITEGTYMNSAPGQGEGSSTMFVPGFIDNNAGTIQQGISCIYLAETTTNAASGVMATLTFKIIGFANSDITLTAGIPTLVNYQMVSQPVDSLNGATYVSPPPAPATSPVAVISGAPATYLANDNFFIHALSSIPGYDPLTDPVHSQQITSYLWSVTGAVTASGTTNNISISAPSTVGGPIIVSLTVTTASTQNPAYVNQGTTTIVIAPGILEPSDAGAKIDIYIVNNATTPEFPSSVFPYKSPTGQGVYNSTVDSYAPQQIMNLAAKVTFNDAEVSDKLVTFIVKDVTTGLMKATFVSYTNASGIAVAQYRLPNYNSEVMEFGHYTISAKVEVVQNIRTDSMTFQYAYTLNIDNIDITPLVARGTTQLVDVTISSTSLSIRDFTVVITIQDCNGVPVASYISNGCAANASSTVTINDFSLLIPTYAYAGAGATVHVNLFTEDPLSAPALPYCPEVSKTFTIGTIPS